MNYLKIPYEVNEQNLRGTALLGAIFCIFALLLQSVVPLYILIFDQIIGLIINPHHTLLGQLSNRFVLPNINFRKRKISTKGKRVAMFLAIGLELAIIICYYYGFIFWFNTLLGSLLLFALSETVLKFCTGYFIFNRLVMLGLMKEELCEDCVMEFNKRD